MKTSLRWIDYIFFVAMIVVTSDAETTEVEQKHLDKEVKIFPGDLPCPGSLGKLIDPLTPLFNTLESQFGVTIPDFANSQNVCNTACGTGARCRFNPTQVILTKGRIHYKCTCIGTCGLLSVPFESSIITCIEDRLNECDCAGGLTARNCVLPLEPLLPTLAIHLAILNPIPVLEVGFCSCCNPSAPKDLAGKENEMSYEVQQNSTIVI